MSHPAAHSCSCETHRFSERVTAPAIGNGVHASRRLARDEASLLRGADRAVERAIEAANGNQESIKQIKAAYKSYTESLGQIKQGFQETGGTDYLSASLKFVDARKGFMQTLRGLTAAPAISTQATAQNLTNEKGERIDKLI